MRSLLKGAVLVAALALSLTPVLAPVAAFAQAASSAVASSAPDSSVVTVTVADHLNPIVEFVGLILEAAAAGLVGMLLAFLPRWARPLITAGVQAAIATFIRQGIGYAVQDIEGFDKDKTISFDVGSAGVASALRYVIEHAPTFLVNLAGGRESIVQKIIAFLTEHGIVLDSSVQPEQVATAALKAS